MSGGGGNYNTNIIFVYHLFEYWSKIDKIKYFAFSAMRIWTGEKRLEG